jgi:hypothetical protein
MPWELVLVPLSATTAGSLPIAAGRWALAGR